ncbi:phage holin [Kosakonia sp. 1610]|uniref:phage holin n=1 Tax=Kosakonia sp. 1610 TaxID=3156426 RepID=UPI003D1D3544
MSTIADVAARASYTSSTISGGYWMLNLLDRITPSQWAAIGVLASIAFGLLTYLTSLYFKIKDDRRKDAAAAAGLAHEEI